MFSLANAEQSSGIVLPSAATWERSLPFGVNQFPFTTRLRTPGGRTLQVIANELQRVSGLDVPPASASASSSSQTSTSSTANRRTFGFSDQQPYTTRRAGDAVRQPKQVKRRQQQRAAQIEWLLPEQQPSLTFAIDRRTSSLVPLERSPAASFSELMNRIQAESRLAASVLVRQPSASSSVDLSAAEMGVEKWAVEPLSLGRVCANDESRVTGPFAIRMRLLRARGYNVLLLPERLHTELYATDLRFALGDTARRESAIGDLVHKLVLRPAIEATRAADCVAGGGAPAAPPHPQVIRVQRKD